MEPHIGEIGERKKRNGRAPRHYCGFDRRRDLLCYRNKEEGLGFGPAITTTINSNGGVTSDLFDEDDGVVHVAKLVRRASIRYQEEEAEKARALTDEQREALQREKEKRANEMNKWLLDSMTKGPPLA